MSEVVLFLQDKIELMSIHKKLAMEVPYSLRVSAANECMLICESIHKLIKGESESEVITPVDCKVYHDLIRYVHGAFPEIKMKFKHDEFLLILR